MKKRGIILASIFGLSLLITPMNMQAKVTAGNIARIIAGTFFSWVGVNGIFAGSWYPGQQLQIGEDFKNMTQDDIQLLRDTPFFNLFVEQYVDASQDQIRQRAQDEVFGVRIRRLPFFIPGLYFLFTGINGIMEEDKNENSLK